MKTYLAGAVLGAVAFMPLLTGCGDSRGYGDAPVEGRAGDDTPAKVYNFPNGYPNVATKCDGLGHRLYVVTHSKTDPPPVVITDPTCPGGKAGPQ